MLLTWILDNICRGSFLRHVWKGKDAKTETHVCGRVETGKVPSKANQIETCIVFKAEAEQLKKVVILKENKIRMMIVRAN